MSFAGRMAAFIITSLTESKFVFNFNLSVQSTFSVHFKSSLRTFSTVWYGCRSICRSAMLYNWNRFLNQHCLDALVNREMSKQ